MRKHLSSSPRLFTVDSANRTLPLVSVIVTDLAPLWRDTVEMRNRIQYLVDNREVEEGNPYSDELTAMQDELDRDSQRAEGYIEELRQVGVEFKGNDHVGFPTMLDGRLVYLSWQLGEPEVSHWIDLDAEFSQRQSLMAGTAPHGDNSSAI